MEITNNTIFYYLREGLWNHCKNYCGEEYKRVNDPSFLFWRAFANYKDGNPNQAINDLNPISKKKEIQYAVTVALIFYHNQCQHVDREAISYLSSSEDSLRRLSGDKSFVLLAYFHLFNNDPREAQVFLDNASGNSADVLVAKGWLELAMNEDDSAAKAFDLFDSVLRDELGGGRNLDALVGKARASEALKKFPVTVETVNEIIVMHPQFSLAQAEKARVLMMITDWEQFIEVIQRVLANEERNFFALQAYIFYLLAQDGNIELGCEKLKFLNGTLEKSEPNNADVFFKCAQLFSRISGRDPDILKVTLSMIDKALKLRPLEADFAIEKAYHFLMMGDVQGAYNQYQEAVALDESKIEPLTGMSQCRLLQGMIDDAEQQIEFVTELQVSVGRTPEMAFLEAMLNNRRPNVDAETKISGVIRFLDEALKLQIAQTKALNQDYSFYIRLNPDFLLSLSKEYFQFLNIDLGKKVEVVPEYVRKGNRLLEIIKKQIPGLLPAHLLLAKGKLGAGDAEASLKHIERVLEINPRHEEANVLYALISFKNGNVRNAKNALDEAIANNFQIRENPYFLMIKGEIELQSQDNEAALVTLEAAYALPIVKTGKPGRGKKADPKVASQMLAFTDKERCKLHVLLAKAYIANGRVTDAKNVMDEAIKNFSGTAEEGTVLMTNAELSVASGDIKKALSILKAVDKTSQYFVDAKKLMADIYLNNLLDRRHYAQCYMDLIEGAPTYENYKLLGDAFMAVQEPEDAGEAYKQAMQLNPSDLDLVRKIGTALIATHDYNQAMAFYEQLLTDQPDRLDLKLDMGKLCIQLNKFDRADKFLRIDVFGDEYGAGTLEALKINVEGLLTIAKLHLKRAGKSNNSNPGMREAYQKAISMQGNVIEATKQVGGNADEERIVLSDINYEMGKYLSTFEKNYELALQYFESAFKYNQASEKILSSMADIHMKQGDLEGAEMRTIQVLKLNPYNQSACFMIADLMMIKGEPEKAIKQYMRVLEYKSGDFTLVSKLIELMYRTGKLSEANDILEKIQKQCPNPNDSGLCYCKGLYQKYSRNPQEALKEFFKAKRGSQFAEDAIVQMVDLYLNPDQDVMFSTIGEGGVKQVEAENLRAADNLIKEMKSRGSGLKGSIAETYVLMFQKGKMDNANKRLADLLGRSPNYVPGLVGQALTKLMNGKKDDAKKLLIMTTKEVFSFEYSEDLEKGWLMLADMLIQSNDLGSAEKVLNECLRYNVACGKAAEYLGLIREKQQSHDEAALFYENAWKFCMERSPSIGYRLAFNYLKSRRYIDCVEICKKILATYPDFSKIDKDIYQRAKAAIRQ